MARADFSALMSEHEIAMYREAADHVIRGWMAPDPPRSSPADRRTAEASRQAIRHHQGTIEDLLIALAAINAANSQINHLFNNWPTAAQGGLDNDALGHISEGLERARGDRYLLEEIARSLFEQLMRDEQTRRPAP
jgi:hypothetical protein